MPIGPTIMWKLAMNCRCSRINLIGRIQCINGKLLDESEIVLYYTCGHLKLATVYSISTHNAF